MHDTSSPVASSTALSTASRLDSSYVSLPPLLFPSSTDTLPDTSTPPARSGSTPQTPNSVMVDGTRQVGTLLGTGEGGGLLKFA